MNNGTRWIIIDTETDGLIAPIHIVELCGQMMNGWQPVGAPFRMLLNHDVHIPAQATAVHGYTRSFLRQHGENPRLVHSAFRDFSQDYPLVAHNLSFDWDRCLVPEWERLGVAPSGRRGFCSLMLARRLGLPTSSHRLDDLKTHFRLTRSRSHQAQNDVLTVVELFLNIYRSRLERAGLNTFESIKAFSTRTPVARCVEIIRGADDSLLGEFGVGRSKVKTPHFLRGRKLNVGI